MILYDPLLPHRGHPGHPGRCAGLFEANPRKLTPKTQEVQEVQLPGRIAAWPGGAPGASLRPQPAARCTPCSWRGYAARTGPEGSCEVIHPFLDGNGRIGRLLIPLFLYDKGLLSAPVFYISAYFEADRGAYYRRLQAISGEGDWQGWIAFFLEAVVTQAERNTAQVQAILSLYDDMKTQIVELTRSQYAVYALDFIFARPLFSSSDFIEATNIPRRTALRLLATLSEAALLTVAEEARGTRPALYAFEAPLKIAG